ncbi:MAG: hypothetical protein PHI06_14260 [Desulfobulbaceae bacterium]|nr:hypothetical protein [Desulfobulbaceae bacterium]
MEQSHSVCGLDGARSANAEAVVTSIDRDLSQGRCVDVSLERNTTDHLHRNLIQLPAPAMVPLGPPIILTQTEKSSFRNPPTVTPPPQLAFLQSVILLI